MKRRLLVLLLLLGTVLYGLVRLLIIGEASRGGSPEESSPTATAAAAYPADLWKQAAAVQPLHLSQGCVEELPADLDWQTGQGQPEIGDPAAIKGGCIRVSNAGPYPAHFLAFGGGTPQFFHYNCFTMVEVALVEQHPVTGKVMPGVAEAWSIRGNTLYYRLDADARYSNGRPVRAADYVLGLVLRAAAPAQSSAQVAAAGMQIAALRTLGERHLAVTLRHPPHELSPIIAARLLPAAEPGFYAEFGSDYEQRYRMRIPPTTGAYTIGRTETGRMVELQHVPHWWAADKPYRRYTCNADIIQHHFLADESQAWELFLRRKLDVIQTRNISAWQEKLNTADVWEGRIERHRFFADYPMPPYGIAFNTQKLADINLRRGLMHALDMQQAISLIFRGEGEQLNTFSAGYGSLSPRDTPRTAYDPETARHYFTLAGYTQRAKDGILQKPDGTRLSVRLTYLPNDKMTSMATTLVQSAAACGAELVAEAVPWQTSDSMLHKGEHELLFWATVAPTPLPDYARHFDSRATGYEAPFRLRDNRMDDLIRQYEAAPTAVKRAHFCAQVDRRLAELACWLPGWKENLVLLACHRYVRFPRTATCDFSTPAPYDVLEAHLYWLDPTFDTRGTYEEVDEIHHPISAP